MREAPLPARPSPDPAEEWLWGWDPTPGIVSVWAEPDGRAFCWRRRADTGELWCERARFRPWLVLSSLEDLQHLEPEFVRASDGEAPRPTSRPTSSLASRPASRHGLTIRELEGPGELRYLVEADDGRALVSEILRSAGHRLGRKLGSLRQLGDDYALHLPPEEQYLVASGRTYFRGLTFDQVRRAQIDLETTSLHPDRGRIFLIAARAWDGHTEILEAQGQGDAAEAELLRQLVAWVRRCDPDVIENHNLHGFDLPFLARRAEVLGVPLWLGRAGGPGLRERPAARGASFPEPEPESEPERDPEREPPPAAGTSDATAAPTAGAPSRQPGGRGPSKAPGGAAGRRAGGDDAKSRRRQRFTVPGRELLDSLDFVRRHDFSARDLPGHGLKAVARHLGLTAADRELVPGHEVHAVYLRDPDRVRRYAAADVEEAAGVSRLLGGAAFALAHMVPRRYERLADAGAATGIIDPLLVRAYLRARAALPAHQPGDGTPHQGAALHLFATGVAERVVKADVASLYPSLMRQYQLGPARDRLGVLLTLVDRLVEQRLAAKARARAAAPASPARLLDEAISAAMKLVVNSAYGYLAAGALTRFSDVHAANRVTEHGRRVLGLLCRELAARGGTLLEADTDGVYFAVPQTWTEQDEQRIVAEVGALLPPLVQLQYDGRYAAMLSHEPKNYALLPYQGPLLLRGVAFRSSRAEPFGEEFLRQAIERLLRRDLPGVQRVYLEAVRALRERTLPVEQIAIKVRLTKAPEEYEAVRGQRRELPYEAMLQSGRERWSRGAVVHVVRLTGGRATVVDPPNDDDDDGSKQRARGAAATARHDYDVDYYVKSLRTTFAARLATGLSPEHFAAVFADPDQLSLFGPTLAGAEPILTRLTDAEASVLLPEAKRPPG